MALASFSSATQQVLRIEGTDDRLASLERERKRETGFFLYTEDV